MNNNKKIIIGVLALLVVMTMGYALFSETVNVGGTAKVDGTFDMEITEASVIEEVGTTGTKVEIIPGGLRVTGSIFEYPSSYVDIKYKFENKGTINAFLTGVKVEGIDLKINKADNTKNAIRLLNMKQKKYYFEPKVISEETFRLSWTRNVNKTEPENVDMKIYFNFEQVDSREAACDKALTMAEKIKKSISTPELRPTGIDYTLYDYTKDGILSTNDTTECKNSCNK